MRVTWQLEDSRNLFRTLLMIATGGKAYACRFDQGCRNASVPELWRSDMGEKYVGNLKFRAVANRSTLAGHR